MGKIVENLTTLYRVLLLVSAIVLTTGAYYQPIVYRFSLGLARVERIDRMYKEFVGDIQADATAFYRAQLLAVFNNQPEWLKSVIARMRFAPAVVTWPAADRQSRRISLYSPDMWISLIFDMAANRQATMSYTEASLNSAQFAKYLSDVHELPNWRSILDTEDVVTTVEIGPQPGQCTLRLQSHAWEQQNRSDLRAALGCTVLQERNISDLRQSFAQAIAEAWGAGWLPLPEELLQLPLKIARDKLAALAAAETTEEKIDLLGAKLGAVAILNIGPLILIVLLLMMLGQMRVATYAPDKDPAENASWFGQFLGVPAFITFPILVLFPTLATAQALDSTYRAPPGSEQLPWWSLLLLWQQKAFVGGTIVVFVLSAGLFFCNVAAARKWANQAESDRSLSEGKRRGVIRSR